MVLTDSSPNIQTSLNSFKFSQKMSYMHHLTKVNLTCVNGFSYYIALE